MKTEIANLLTSKYGKKNPPVLKAGDTVRIHQKIKEGEKERVQIFEGLVIALKHGNGLDGTFTVRKIASGGVGVERTYPLHSPNVLKVERIKNADVNRAKLYYMRDRLGKAARFKNEDRTPASWDENSVAAEAVMEVEAEQINAEEEIIEAIEGVEPAEEPVAELTESAEAEIVAEATEEAVSKEEAAETPEKEA